MLQHTAAHPKERIKALGARGGDDKAKVCNTLQYAATHCNTLQHTAAHRNIPERTHHSAGSALR